MSPPIPVLAPPPELTGATLAAFEAEVLRHVDTEVAGLVVDLGQVHFVDSTGLGILVKAGLRLDARQKRLALARPRDAVARAISIVGLGQILRTFASLQGAMDFVAGLPGREGVRRA